MPRRTPIHRPSGWRPREEARAAKERDAYYGSRHWRDLRDRVGRRDGWRCAVVEDGERCGRDAPTVHHMTPRPRGAEGPTAQDVDGNCLCICDRHHGAEHRDKGRWDRMKD